MRDLQHTSADAIASVQNLLNQQQDGALVAEEFLFSKIDVVGSNNGQNALTSGTKFSFFTAAMNDTNGLGYARQITLSDTNHDGTGNLMSSSKSFVAAAVGVAFGMNMPAWLKIHFSEWASLVHTRNKLGWDMGGIRHWPQGDIGVQAQSTQGSGADYAVNGRVAAREFRDLRNGIILPAGQKIELDLTIDKGCSLVLDPTVGGSPALVADAGITIEMILDGFSFNAMPA